EELRSLLRRLAYYQRAAGQPDRLPKSLRKPLDSAARTERELTFLRRDRRALDEKQQARLRRLEARAEAGEEASGSPARLVRQAREVCALTALEAARALFRREVETWWRQRLDVGLDAFRWDDLGTLTTWVEGLRPDERT